MVARKKHTQDATGKENKKREEGGRQDQEDRARKCHSRVWVRLGVRVRVLR